MSRPAYLVSTIARQRLDEIYSYTREHWDDQQADAYVRDLFAYFGRIVAREVVWRSIAVKFGVEGFYGSCGHHHIYWRELKAGQVGIVTIPHERMHQISRFRNDVAP